MQKVQVLLLGTGGVLLAVQLLIGALQSERVIKFIKSLKGLSPRLRELSDLSKGFSEATEELVGNFDMYTRKLMDSNKSRRAKGYSTKEVESQNIQSFNASILTSADNTEEATEAIDKYIETKRLAQSQAANSKKLRVNYQKSKFDNQLKQFV